MIKKPTRGFTLLELMVALGILTIVSTGVFVSLRSNESNTEQRNLQNASLALQADLRYVQRRAIMEGQSYRILFEIFNNRYHIQINTTPRQTIRIIYFQDGVRLTHMTLRNELTFYPRGTISNATTITLINGRYQQQLTTTVSGGRAQIGDIGPA